LDLTNDKIMPALFVGHGSPMNAIEDNEFSKAWEKIGAELPKPKAILCISAHWFVNELAITAMEKPKTIHDFYGFPKELYDVKYPAPGAPQPAEETHKLLIDKEAGLNMDWGLDHGTWSVLCRMFPEAAIPTYQLSINSSMPPEYHFEIGKRIKAFRSKGVLIIGSGNIVHNLPMMKSDNTPYEWAVEFDNKSEQLIYDRDFESLVNYHNLGKEALLSIPTPDHYFPLLYILGAASKDEEINFFAEGLTLGSISMRSLRIG